MPFPQSWNFTLADQRGDVPNDPAIYFWANVRGPDTNSTVSALRLDDLIGSINGSLVVGLNTKDFSKKARNVKIMADNNSALYAELLMDDGKTWKRSVLDLSGYVTSYVSTDGGRTKCHIQWVRNGLPWYDESMQPHAA